MSGETKCCGNCEFYTPPFLGKFPDLAKQTTGECGHIVAFKLIPSSLRIGRSRMGHDDGKSCPTFQKREGK